MLRRPSSSFTVVAIVLIVAAVVVLASRGTPVWMLVRGGHPDRAGVLVLVATICVVGAVVALAVSLVLHHAVLVRRLREAPPFRATLLRALPITCAIIALTSLLAISESGLSTAGSPEGRPAHVPEESGRPGSFLNITGWFNAAGSPSEDQRDDDGLLPRERDPGPGIPPLVVVAAIVVAVLAGVTFWRLRAGGSGAAAEGAGEGGWDGADREAVHGAVVMTIDGMLADPDPNTAIIGAYARLLERLAACGAERRSHEAPMEHIQRVLGVRRVRAAPLRELIGLFEIARFSTHALDASHRDRALEALRAVAADLAPGEIPMDAADAPRPGSAGP